jgi:hypothetical protein
MRRYNPDQRNVSEGQSLACVGKALAFAMLFLLLCADLGSAQANPGRLNTLQYTRPVAPAPIPEVDRLKENQARMYRYIQTGDPALEREIERFLGVRPVPSLGQFQPRRPGDLQLEREIQSFLGTPTAPSLGSRVPRRPRPTGAAQTRSELPPTDPDSEPCLVKPYLSK